MKTILTALLFATMALPLWAQTVAATGQADFEAERARLSQERKVIEERFNVEQKACYQKFAVEGCLQESRQKRRAASDDIKRQEAAINGIERKRRGAAEMDKLEEKKAGERPQDSAPQREQSQKSQQDRESRAADHATSRAGVAAEAATRQRQFDEKQRAHAADQAKAAERRATAPTERERYEHKLERARDHAAELDRRNAGRTKPRAAALPSPPP
jgi:colicin import membrane protein